MTGFAEKWLFRLRGPKCSILSAVVIPLAAVVAVVGPGYVGFSPVVAWAQTKAPASATLQAVTGNAAGQKASGQNEIGRAGPLPTQGAMSNSVEPIVPPIRRVHPSRVAKEARKSAKAVNVRDAAAKKQAGAKLTDAKKQAAGVKSAAKPTANAAVAKGIAMPSNSAATAAKR